MSGILEVCNIGVVMLTNSMDLLTGQRKIRAYWENYFENTSVLVNHKYTNLFSSILSCNADLCH